MSKATTFPPISHHKTPVLVTSIMIMQRALSRHLSVPSSNALQMESAETLQPCHILSSLVLFEANATLRLLNAIFLRGLVREYCASEVASTERWAILTENDGCVGLFTGCGSSFRGIGYRGRSGRRA